MSKNKLNGVYVHDVITDLQNQVRKGLETIASQKEAIRELVERLRKCGALAGHPDAVKGCRHICIEVREAMAFMGEFEKHTPPVTGE